MQTAGFTQADLARKAGIAGATVHRLVKGSNVPDPETVEAIARATNVPFRYLFMGETEPDSPLFENEGDLFRSVPMNRGKVGAGPAMLEADGQDVLGIDLQTISAILGHVTPDISRATRIYARGKQLETRREALQAWADWLDSLRWRPRTGPRLAQK